MPPEFAFSVKLPRAITHELRLSATEPALDSFADQTAGLGGKLRCVLIQLPPSLDFNTDAAGRFFQLLRERFTASAVIEARHASWFTDDASALLRDSNIGRVHADPPAVPVPIEQTASIHYFRMHGSPRMYYSKYDEAAIADLANLVVAAPSGPTWCIFDNTAHGHATADALALQELLASR